MAYQSLLQIVQGTATRLNLAVPAAAIASTDPTIQQLVACTQDAGDELVERWTWLALKSALVKFTGDGVTASFTLPADFDTLSPSMTFVSSSYPTLIMPGPVNEDDLLRMKLQPVTVSPSCWRRIGSSVEFFPVLGLNETASYVYAQGLWILDVNGTTKKAAWTADTDTPLIADRLIRLGAIYKWKRMKGLDYGEEMQDYERSFNSRSGQEDTGREIRTSYTLPAEDTWYPGMITYNGP